MTTAKTAALPLLLVLALGAIPDRAEACGGFFCNNSSPVNQQAERIIFSVGSDGTVTAVIQILYSGPSERFAWVLPVGGTPEVGVSSNQAFARLQSVTNPQYILSTTLDGSCFGGFPGGGADSGAFDGGADGGGAMPPVRVLDSGSVGPYDYVTIAVDPAAEDEVAVALQWLRDNDYDVPDEAGERLRSYLAGGMNLLAFRLTKENSVGSIRPVMIRFGRGLPMIPIRPTALAAMEDMGVMVFVLGPHRAVPVNYHSLVLNEALINWLNPGLTYGDVINAAADEAGGHGFVTEMAGSAAGFDETIVPGVVLDRWRAIALTDWTLREGDLLFNVLASFGGYDGMRDAVAATLPLPPGVSVDSLLACVSCYYDSTAPDIAGFEPAAFIAAVEEQAMEPLRRTRELFRDAPYLTRLYTTMSPDEMVLDPVFDFNADLPDFSNVHRADRVIECGAGGTFFDAPWRVVLESGEIIRGEGTTWPFTPGGEMPANRTILRIGNEGGGEVVTDNARRIRRSLNTQNERVPVRPGTGLATGGGACAVGSGPAPAAWLTLLGLVLALLRRRR